ncbi:MAG: efflux RND transporter permease subunit [Treponema sp.]|nr:efflux RND transporter permease subunit [Treponema sp.]
MNRDWFTRYKSSLCLILGLLAFSFYILIAGDVKDRKKNEAFSIIQRHYGVDASEMERTAVIPLEDALTRINGVKKIRSNCENGAVRVFVYFEGNDSGRYEAVREAAQAVYESLPPSAQRPEILSSDDTRIPLWTAAVSAKGNAPLGRLLERTVKPALEGLEGAGEVEISGTGLNEIVITVKSEELAARGIDPAYIGAVLGENDLVVPAGTLDSGDRELTVTADGRYGDLRSLRNALIPVEVPVEGGRTRNFVMLKDLAEITEREREGEIRSRLNGKKTAVIALMGGPGADAGILSRRIKKELERFAFLPLEFTVLSDRGEEERTAYRSVLAAALQGSAAVALMTLLLTRNAGGFSSVSLVCALTVPAALLFSAVLLTLMGVRLEKFALAGLSAGTGAAVDAAILGAEYFRRCITVQDGRKAFLSLRFPLISGSLTTIIALFPLTLNNAGGQITQLVPAIGSVNFVSMVLALTLLPPLFLWGKPENAVGAVEKKRMPRIVNAAPPCTRIDDLLKIPALRLGPFLGPSRFFRPLRRFLAWGIHFCSTRPLTVLAGWTLLTLAGAAALYTGGADTGQQESEDSVYAALEFEGGLHVEESDRLLAAYAETLSSVEGIVNIQTGARTGSGSALVTFDRTRLKAGEVRALMRGISIPGAFVYIGESSAGERNWEIKISGDDGTLCRELASAAARICGKLSLVKETVLCFKEGSPRLSLKPDRSRLAVAGLSFSRLGSAARQDIHGPVAYKRLNQSGETDVRIRGGGLSRSGDEIKNILISGKSGPLRLGALVDESRGIEPASIQREDRRRTASIALRTTAMDPRRARDEIMPALGELSLPPGYSIEFDREALKAAEAVSYQGFLFLLALLFCYMVLAAARESLILPLAILAVVPPSLALPALCLAAAGGGLNAESAAAFVAVSGMAVNAAVLSADALAEKALPGTVLRGHRLYLSLRKRLPVLAATTSTTIAGAAPFLLLRNGAAAAVRSLALVGALGVAVSALCSITLIPALAALIPGLLKKSNEPL